MYTFDTALFREQFPAFTDVVRYPDAMIAFWSSIAINMLIEARWGSVYTQGLSLYVAHEISLAAADAKQSSVGKTPGQGNGLVSNKAVGSASKGYDNASSIEKDAGFWNLTTYGQQFYRLSRMIGAGALQV